MFIVFIKVEQQNNQSVDARCIRDQDNTGERTDRPCRRSGRSSVTGLSLINAHYCDCSFCEPMVSSTELYSHFSHDLHLGRVIFGQRSIMKALLLFLLVLGPAVAQNPSLNENCVNWENSTADYTAAIASWVEPACYNFSYTFLGFRVGQPQPQKRQIVDGTALNVADGVFLHTLQDFYDMIYDMCVLNCPGGGGNGTGAHQCNNNYTNVSGVTYPEYINIDVYQVKHYMNLE
jgi:hypothetical protein